MSPKKKPEILEGMLVIRQDVAATQANSSYEGTLRRFEIRRRCKDCGTILSRYNSSMSYCFVHDTAFGRSR